MLPEVTQVGDAQIARHPLVTRHTKAYCRSSKKKRVCSRVAKLVHLCWKNTPPARTASTEATHQHANEYGSIIQPRWCCWVSIIRPTGLSSSLSFQPLPSTSRLSQLLGGRWEVGRAKQQNSCREVLSGGRLVSRWLRLCRKTHRNFFLSKHVQRNQSRRAGRRVGHGTRPTHDLIQSHHFQ